MSGMLKQLREGGTFTTASGSTSYLERQLAVVLLLKHRTLERRCSKLLHAVDGGGICRALDLELVAPPKPACQLNMNSRAETGA